MLIHAQPTNHNQFQKPTTKTELKAQRDAAAAAAAEEERQRQLQRGAIATPGRAPPRRMTTPRRPVGL
jgi:hypothetical protein